MKINEVEKLLEIPKATIRYYEEEGLIKPARTEAGYREYNEDDIETLKRIIILRKMGISVDAIRRIMNGEESLYSAAERSRDELQEQIKELTGAISLCNQVIADETTVYSLNTNATWERIKTDESRGIVFASILDDFADFQSDMFGFPVEREDPAAKKLIRLVILLTLVVVCSAGIGAALGISPFADGVKEKITAVAILAIIFSAIYLISRKNKKAGDITLKAVRIISFAIILIAVLFLAVAWLNNKLHFWF